MFNVGGPEILVIFLVALIVLGPQQLPKAMRTFGSVMAEVRKVSNNFQAEMRNAMDTVVDTSATEKPHTALRAEVQPVVARVRPHEGRGARSRRGRWGLTRDGQLHRLVQQG